MRSVRISTRYTSHPTTGAGLHVATAAGRRLSLPIDYAAPVGSGHERAARQLAARIMGAESVGTVAEVWTSDDGARRRFVVHPAADPLPPQDYRDAGARGLFVGRQADGSRVYVDIRRTPRGAVTLTDHAHAESVDELGISGLVYGPRTRIAWCGGQCRDELRKVTRPAGTLTARDIADLADIWDRWHLNTLHGACAHMGATSTACPVTGYRYGSAWLAEVVPDDAWRRLAEIIAAAQEVTR